LAPALPYVKVSPKDFLRVEYEAHNFHEDFSGLKGIALCGSSFRLFVHLSLWKIGAHAPTGEEDGKIQSHQEDGGSVNLGHHSENSQKLQRLCSAATFPWIHAEGAGTFFCAGKLLLDDASIVLLLAASAFVTLRSLNLFKICDSSSNLCKIYDSSSNLHGAFRLDHSYRRNSRLQKTKKVSLCCRARLKLLDDGLLTRRGVCRNNKSG
jgi:hypothetical protein